MDLPLESPAKRRAAEKEQKRAARACDGCRRLKEKCDGGVPCRRCFRLGRQCDFSDRALRGGSRSGPQPVPRNSTLDRNSDLVRRVTYLEKIVKHYAGDINLDTGSLQKLAESVDSAQPAKATSESSGFAELDEKFRIQTVSDNTIHYSGEFSHWNLSMRIKEWIDQSIPHDERNQGQDTTTFKEYWRAEELQSQSSVTSAVSALPPRAITDFLVHCFFKHAQSNYFYIERDWLMRKIDIAYHSPASLSRRDVGTICVIFITLAIGTQYAYLEALAERNQHSEADFFSEDAIGVRFFQQACKLLPDVITLSSLESVQACLLLGIYTLPVDASGLSYVYLNLALKLAIQNGMHRACPKDSVRDGEVRELRDRVWWAVYTIERRVGIFHGRPMSIAATDVDANPPVDRTDMWPSTSSAHTAHFMETLRLNGILSNMAQEISILRTQPKQNTSEGLAKLVALHHELRTWWDTLPTDTFIKEPTPQLIARRTMHLKLEYCLVRMFAGRPFILPREFNRGTSSPSTSSDGVDINANPAASSRGQIRSILVMDCIEAALSVVDTCRFLRDSIGLARTSYTEFSTCRAALLVITTQCLLQRTHKFRQMLRDGLVLLKEMSAGSESARSEVSLIEAFERAITKMDVTGDTSTAVVDSEYARFKRWEQLWKNDSSFMELMSDVPQDPAIGTAPVADHLSLQGFSVPSSTLFMDTDTTNTSFLQTMEEFSTIFGCGFGPNFDGQGM